MDASASTEVHEDINKVCGSFHPMQEAQVSGPRLKNTTLKYTRLPDYNIDPKVSWPQTDSYILHPKLRRIVALEDEEIFATHSLKNEIPIKMMSSTLSKRKIVTISEDLENVRHPRFSNSQPVKKTLPRNLLNKSVETVRTSGRSPNKNKITVRESKPNTLSQQAKPEILKKGEGTCANYKARLNYAKNLIIREKDPSSASPIRWQKNPNTSQKTSISRKKESPSKSVEPAEPRQRKESPIKNAELGNKVLIENIKINVHNSLPKQQPRLRTISPRTKNVVKDGKTKPVTLIRVPLVGNHTKEKGTETEIINSLLETKSENFPSATRDPANSESVNTCIQIKPQPEKTDSMTLTDEAEIRLRNETMKVDSDSQTYFNPSELSELYDNLDIPNVTLTGLRKDISDVTKENRIMNSQSLPNLDPPAIKIISSDNEITNIDEMCKSASFIIGRATVTYTTKQKIDFHVLGQKGERKPRVTSPLTYPLNVVSIFRKGISKQREISDGRNVDNTHKDLNESATEYDTREVDCSYSRGGKLVKPSDVISTIRLDDGLIKNDFMCEQFQRELNFIDSFIESLQYLERCSSSGQGFTERKIENWVRYSGFNVRNADYDQYFPKIENGADMDDSKTIAAKSLCLLNLLIRDEQRRAKNLLFVLKMREDALKDFTKSQIIWLENKKKQDNIDIPTLKKKQRGALLKLQHECGEMQRMRKALLTLSEKRRIALLKTKNNIELKLNNKLNVNDLLLNKKKIKRNTVGDRNTAPLKCFDLSSSGCDESGPQRGKSDTALVVRAPGPVISVVSHEKSIQTGQSLVFVDDATAGDNFIRVDGGYLNILFGNLGLPSIFSGGRQYDVNEEALRNLVNSSNKHHEDDYVEKFIDQIRCRDLERSSTPSTARSLVDELDMYYKGMVEDPQTDDDTPQNTVPELLGADTQVTHCDLDDTRSPELSNSTATLVSSQSEGSLETPEDKVSLDTLSVETQVLRGMDPVTMGVQAGPLPVPAGAAAPDPLLYQPGAPTGMYEDEVSIPQTSSAPELSLREANVLLVPVARSVVTGAPAHGEAEELRRQQLAIEKEIKALEQQQSQLLVVREIPDKPPPPYTPPVETRTPLPRKFLVDDTTIQRVEEHIYNPIETESTDTLDAFIKDFCLETAETTQEAESDSPWDPCNLLPQKKPIDPSKLVHKTTSELRDVLTVGPATMQGVGGLGSRRSDHVDEILFAEWRRCETSWTALHTDETEVKNQLFENIFQRVLSETVEQYKRTVLARNDSDTSDSQRADTTMKKTVNPNVNSSTEALILP